MPAATVSDALGVYLRDIGRYPLLSRSDEVRLARAAAAGDDGARQRLVECNLRLVVTIARGYRGHGVDALDLIQEGNLGLMAAAERFDWRQDVRFATYASWWIRRAITKAASTAATPVRLPERLPDAIARVRYAERALEQRLQRSPSLREVADESGLSEAAVAEARRASGAVLSIHEPLGGGEATLEEMLEDPSAGDAASGVIEDDERAGLRAALCGLEDRARTVVELRYGLRGDSPRSLTEVASGLGLSRERVRQVEAKTLRRLATHPRLQPARIAA